LNPGCKLGKLFLTGEKAPILKIDFEKYLTLRSIENISIDLSQITEKKEKREIYGLNIFFYCSLFYR
jgi:hypothetical protein